VEHRMWHPLPQVETSAAGLWLVVADEGGPSPAGDRLAGLLTAEEADRLCAEHNAAVRAARGRPAVGDLEVFARRVLVAALRELIRDALPWRRRNRAHTARG
jgi:hypothetical protein